MTARAVIFTCRVLYSNHRMGAGTHVTCLPATNKFQAVHRDAAARRQKALNWHILPTVSAVIDFIKKGKFDKIVCPVEYSPWWWKCQKQVSAATKLYMEFVHEHTVSEPLDKVYRKYTPFARAASATIERTPAVVASNRIVAGSGISTQIAAGAISARDVWARGDEEVRRGLLWRDFYYQLTTAYPKMYHEALYPKYDIRWKYNENVWREWITGSTGYPIVDAAMRQLRETGEMPNRWRMVVASHLIKYSQIDWRRGMAYFTKYLADYDDSLNMQNWQWCASTGADAQPWFRLMSPLQQHLRFDSDSTYCNRWLSKKITPSRPRDIRAVYPDDSELRKQILARYSAV